MNKFANNNQKFQVARQAEKGSDNLVYFQHMWISSTEINLIPSIDWDICTL